MHTTNGVNTHNGHEFVDLGLPSGTLWATCNVGASSPEQAGLYFAFGETEGFTAEQVEKGVRKFNKTSYKAKKFKSELTSEEDAAHVNMGEGWRMPTYNEWQELIDNCDTAWTDDYNGTGIKGRIFTSKVNGNSVFLPAAGVCNGSSVNYVGSWGYYWSASYSPNNAGISLFFTSSVQPLGAYGKDIGRVVRAVCE